MYKGENQMTRRKKTKRKLHYGRALLCLGIVMAIGGSLLYSVHSYNYPSIYGKWESTQTNRRVKFNKDGTVTLQTEGSTPIFTLISSNKMNYTVDKKVFEMYYNIEGRTLYWGQNEDSVEIFIRK